VVPPQHISSIAPSSILRMGRDDITKGLLR